MSRPIDEALVSSASVEAARAIAAGLVLGIDIALQEGRPLTQLQQADLWQGVLMEYDGHGARLAESLRVSRTLEQLADDAGGAS